MEPEKEEQTKPKANRRNNKREEIIKIIVEINNISNLKIEKIKPLYSLTKKKEQTQITKIRNESGDITTNYTEIKRIIKNTINNCIPTHSIT